MNVRMKRKDPVEFRRILNLGINKGFGAMLAAFRHEMTTYDDVLNQGADYIEVNKKTVIMFYQMYQMTDKNQARQNALKVKLIHWLEVKGRI